MSCSVREWKILQESKPHYSKWLLVFRTQHSKEHKQSSRIECNPLECWSNTRTQYSWYILGSYRLSTKWRFKPSPHSSSCHRDPCSRRGHPLCRLCDIQPESTHQQSLIPRRCFCISDWPHSIIFSSILQKTNGVAFAGLSSQNPGVITIANATFGSNPPINPDVLAKAF